MKPYPEYKPSGIRWLGGIPRGWSVRPLRAFAKVLNGADYKEVESSQGYPVIGSGGPFAFASDYLHDGESVLLGRKGTIDRPLYVNGRFWIVDTMFYTTIAKEMSAKFFYYACTAIPFAYYSTATALPSMTKAALEGHRLAAPPPSEQQAIAEYLDRETARIDELIAEQDSLVSALGEWREAAITHAVTHEIGIAEGEGETQVSWTRRKWTWVAQIRRGLVDPELDPYRGMALVAPNHVEKGTGRLMEASSASEQGAESGKYLVKRGDLIYSKIRPALRKAVIAPDDCLCSADMYAITSLDGQIMEHFMLYLLLARPFTDLAVDASQRVAMPKVNREALEAFRLVLPPVGEQCRIVDQLDKLTERIDELMMECRELVALLKERRSALITAAVTGQIDVRAG